MANQNERDARKVLLEGVVHAKSKPERRKPEKGPSFPGNDGGPVLPTTEPSPHEPEESSRRKPRSKPSYPGSSSIRRVLALVALFALAFSIVIYFAFGLRDNGQSPVVHEVTLPSPNELPREIRSIPDRPGPIVPAWATAPEGTPADPNTGFARNVIDKTTGISMVLIAAGRFSMGTPAGERDAEPNEQPVREVDMPGYYLGEFEVTQGEWKRVMNSNPSQFQFQGSDSHPVENVSWNDVQPFLNETGFRLPTEPEWEYACRAGTRSPFSFGEDLSPKQAQFGGAKTTMEVGSFLLNPWGLADMHGNVSEWCAEESGDSSNTRAIRGGCWYSVKRHCRSAYRQFARPFSQDKGYGFRVARNLRS